MVNVLRNRWLQYVVTAMVFFTSGFFVTHMLTQEPPIPTESPDHVLLNAEVPGLEELIPLTAAAALGEGWKLPFRCVKRSGRNLGVAEGRYFDKGEKETYYRIVYTKNDSLLGVYLYSEKKMPGPWEYVEDGFTQVPSLDFEHWSLPVYFKSPFEACGRQTFTSGSQ